MQCIRDKLEIFDIFHKNSMKFVWDSTFIIDNTISMKLVIFYIGNCSVDYKRRISYSTERKKGNRNRETGQA